MTTATILDSEVQYYVEDNQTYWQLTDILKLLREDGNNFLSVAPKSEYIAYNQKLGSAVSSKVIAKCFGKLHKNVIQGIESSITELQNQSAENPALSVHDLQTLKTNYNFECVTNTDKLGTTKEYFVNEGLFNLVVLSYTGQNAFKWKVNFINEFLRLRLESQKLSAAPNLIEAVKKATSKLYVLADTKNPNLFKIGITERPIEQRLKELNATVSSSVVCLWESLPCINARHLESELHTFFKDKQVKSETNESLSEWFRLSEFDLRDLQGILKMNFRYQALDICLIK